MWTFEYRHESTADADAIWALWSDPGRWPAWDTDLEEVTLDGEFVAGAHGTLKPRGMDAIPIHLTRVEPASGYSDETELPGALLRFDHDLHERGDGVEIVQRVTMSGPSAPEYFDSLGKGIVLDVPGSLRRLAEVAEAS
jgi:Polyketide cyclase / dehydrase and lipid transport